MQVKKKGQTCAEGLKINPLAQVCPWVVKIWKWLKYLPMMFC